MAESFSRGKGLLLFGVAFHAIYVLSIFDIYFKSPIVHHIESEVYSDSTLEPPAKRAVIFVGDGCRADRFFEINSSSVKKARTPFIRNIIEHRGSWGVSHTRVPTESRPGHVALFAGMYEDVSAVTKGWQDNPVDFDSIFNQSSHSWLFGSPDIVPMFTRRVPQAHELHYSSEEEDFAKDASELDVWVYNKLKGLLAEADTNKTLNAQLRSPRVIFFCHFLGIDTNGHAHRPNSDDYLNNIVLVDKLVEKMYNLLEDFYERDGKTSYIVTADHGMSNKGAHGDGDPANTRTPLVVWGAGVEGPVHRGSSKTKGFQIDLPTQSKEQVMAQIDAQKEQEEAAESEWGLLHLTRKDVMQADVAPLISSLLGIPYPRNSVGVLPFTFLRRGKYRAKAVMSNAKQLYLHALRKEQEKEAHTIFFFRPFDLFRQQVPQMLNDLRTFWSQEEFNQVENLSQRLIAACLATLHYFQRYDWFFLFSVILAGYIGWMLVLVIAVVDPNFYWKQLFLRSTTTGIAASSTSILVSDEILLLQLFIVFMFLAVESSPITYYLYMSYPVLFWRFAWKKRSILKSLWNTKETKSSSSTGWRWSEMFLVVLCLELVVVGYTHRSLFGVIFALLSMWPYLEARDGKENQATQGSVFRFWSVSCLLLAIFPFLPTEYGEHTSLVTLGGLVFLMVARYKLAGDTDSTSISSIGTQVVCVLLSLVTLNWTMVHLEQKSKPPMLLTVANWILSIGSIISLLFTTESIEKKKQGSTSSTVEDRAFLRLTRVMMAFVPAYILLSISYEVLFYVALCLALSSWVRMEHLSSMSKSQSRQKPNRAVSIQDFRTAFLFLLFIKIAFFGTGNVASMSSFEISSTYRFVTVFAPFLMGFLLVIKILIPFTLVGAAFHVIVGLQDRNPYHFFLLVVGLSDYLSIHFLFLVENEGSWKQIGNSISMFGIVNAQIIFIPLVFVLSRVFLQDLFTVTRKHHHNKAL